MERPTGSRYDLHGLLHTVFASLLLTCPTVVDAQIAGASAGAVEAATGSIAGTVVDADGTAVGAARVTLQGMRRPVEVQTSADGTFTLAGIAPGTYSIAVTCSGFKTAQEVGIPVVGGIRAAVRVILARSSFSSLRTIGQTSTSSGNHLSIDTTPGSVALIPSQTFSDQGQVQVANILNETPGIITTRSQANGASQGAAQVAQIRGGLAYETESLIDGHPISVGATGAYDPLLINPGLLENVELVKGPGSFPTEINSAIGGTVNYRTVEPTSTPHESFAIGSDQYGGASTTMHATGSTHGHFVDYAFGIATNGTNGPLENYPLPSSTSIFSFLGNRPYLIDGREIGPIFKFVPANTPQYAGYPGTSRLAQPLYFCCSPISTFFHQDGELGKVRLNLSQQTALTLSYVGGQAIYDNNAAGLASFEGPNIHFFNFVPPAGYTGSVPSGTDASFDDNAGNPQTTSSQANLFQAELRTALGPVTVLGRLYSSYARDLTTSGSPTNTPQARTLNTWGGALVCPSGDSITTSGSCNLPSGAPGPAPTLTFFNGQPATIVGFGGVLYDLTQDHLHGYSLQLTRPLGFDTFSLAIDRSNHDSNAFLDSSIESFKGYQLAPGSGQQFTTLSAQAQILVAKDVSVTVADYLIAYASHYSGDGGATWSDSSHTFNAPRLGLSARPNADTSLRFSLGGSIAPPYISLLSAPAGAPIPNVPGKPTYYTQNVNDGQVRPETAFGYDVGIDRRIGNRLTLSADVYLTTLRDSFLDQTYQNGTYTATSGVAIGQTAPLYVTQTANLGHARYEGIEAAIDREPAVGFGFRVQGSLMRAFPYAVPNSLYATTSGPFRTNLAVVPNVNFEPSGISYNGVEGAVGRVAYSQGYAEVEYRTRRGAYANLGVTYYGNNNTYNNPAFGVVSATIRYPLTPNGSISLSGFNLTQAYAQPYLTFFGGIPVPLVNGSHGATTGNLGVIESGNVGPATYRLIISEAIGH